MRFKGIAYLAVAVILLIAFTPFAYAVTQEVDDLLKMVREVIDQTKRMLEDLRGITDRAQEGDFNYTKNDLRAIDMPEGFEEKLNGTGFGGFLLELLEWAEDMDPYFGG